MEVCLLTFFMRLLGKSKKIGLGRCLRARALAVQVQTPEFKSPAPIVQSQLWLNMHHNISAMCGGGGRRGWRQENSWSVRVTSLLPGLVKETPSQGTETENYRISNSMFFFSLGTCIHGCMHLCMHARKHAQTNNKTVPGGSSVLPYPTGLVSLLSASLHNCL